MSSKHGRTPKYIPGNNWVECERCGFTYRRSSMRKEWTGLTVCGPCWEPRHPQDLVRVDAEDVTAQEPRNPDSLPPTLQESRLYNDIGDSDVTLDGLNVNKITRFKTNFTVGRTVTLDTTNNPISGASIILIKNNTGTLTIQNADATLIKSVPVKHARAVVGYNGQNWDLINYTVLEN